MKVSKDSAIIEMKFLDTCVGFLTSLIHEFLREE